MSDEIAVLDIGTNTFHLMIVKFSNSNFNLICREKIFVKLAEDGIGHIGDNPFSRGINALNYFRKVLNQRQIEKIFAFGTATLRTADNSNHFINAAYEKTGIPITVISGQREAELIKYGIQQAVDFETDPYLIIDIGGGSVELIVANKEDVRFSESFMAGAAILRKKFHRHEPIRSQEIKYIHQYLEKELAPFTDFMKGEKIKKVIGASGSFDTMGEMLFYPSTEEKLFESSNAIPITIDQFDELYKRLVHSTMEERLQIKGLVSDRAEMMVVAIVLCQWLLEKANPEEIILSNYALKEGILWSIKEEKLLPEELI